MEMQRKRWEKGSHRSAGAPTLATLRRALQPQLLPSFPVYRPHPNLGRLQGGGKGMLQVSEGQTGEPIENTDLFIFV